MKIFGFFLSSAAILLTFGRCSPIAPSVYKNALSKSETGSIPPLPSTQSAAQTPGQASGSDSAGFAESTFKSSVVNVSEIGPMPAGRSRIVLSADERKEAFQEFRDSGHTLITLGSENPVNATGTFGVSLERDEIAAQELNRSFQVSFRSLSGDTYLLAIAPQTSPDVARAVTANLVSVVLEFDSQ